VAQKKQELQRHLGELEECVRERTHELRELLHREQAARAELEETKMRLEEAERQREDFVAMVAHDLGAPLTTVRGYAEMLGRPTTRPEVRERARSVIVAETSRMARLVGDLADSAHLASGRFEIEPIPCDLVAVAREQAELVQGRSSQHEIVVEAPTELSVWCDCDRIAQVLFNLLNNALTYTSNGRIELHLWQEPSRVRFSVSDRGPGIPAESLDAVFEAGRRLHNGETNGQSKKGSGLGLYIAKGIVEAHGGEIWVESSQGQGATFHVSLPTAAPRTESDEVEAGQDKG
jgi:signal transduction histidine kinase